MNDSEILELLHQSPQKGHRALFDEYYSYVYAISVNILRDFGSREDIEECVCDVFADVFLSYDSDKDVSGDISGFIGTFARRRAAAVYRKISSRAETVALDDEAVQFPDAAQDVEHMTDDSERRRLLLDAVAELGVPDSTIIIQKYYYGRSAKEIAKMLSLTPENIRVRSGRAVRKLKEMLEKSGISL